MKEPEVIFCDNHVLVAVKPPNMPSQADESGDLDMFSAMKAYVKEKYQKPGEVYLGLLHRLDRPVGGLMAFARTSKAASRLSEQLRTHAMYREYLAVVQGTITGEGEFFDYLLQDGNKVRTVGEGTDGAKQARLHYRVLGTCEGLSLAHIRLETGRKHQIRVQFASHGLPLWGDARYGGGHPGEQIALWGVRLMFTHPTRHEEQVFFSAPSCQYPWSLFTNEINTFKTLAGETSC